MKRIYHPYWLWEDYKAGFYNNCSGSIKKDFLSKVVLFFNDENLTREFMYKVVDEWENSCEHNFTNESMNKIAYLGQSAVCLWNGIPNTVTMEAWSLLSKDVQIRSNNIATEVIEYWKNKYKNKQLCLKLD